MLKKLFFDSFIYAFLPKLPMVLGFVLMPITTKILTPFDYGVYGVIMAYFGVLSGFRELGFGVNLSNAYWKRRKKYQLIWRNLLAFFYTWGAVYAFIFGILLYFVIPSEASHNKWIIIPLILIPIVVFSPITRIGALYFQLERKPIPVTSIGVVSSMVGLGVSFFCIVYLKLGYMSWFISTFVSSTLSGIVYYYIFTFKKGFTPIFRFNKRTYKRYLSVGLPMIPHQWAGYLLNSSDRLVLDAMGVSNEDIGRYNFSYNFGSVTSHLATGLAQGARPYFYSIISKDTKDKFFKFRKLTFFLQGISLCATFLISIWLREGFNIMVNNDELRAMYPLAVFFVMSYSMNTLYQNVSIIHTFNEKTGNLWKISFIAGVVNVGLNLAFIPLFGYKVAAITTLLSLMYFGFSGTYLKTYKKFQPLRNYTGIWMFAILILTGAAYYLVNVNIFIKIIISLVVIGVALYAYLRHFKGVFNEKE